MATSRKEVWPQHLPRAATPIKYVTENGFSIVRLCEVDRAINNSPTDCGFLVQRDDGPVREIHASFAGQLVADLLIRRRTPLSDTSVFWLVCAESCLANYLWEFDEFPLHDYLAIQHLSPDELMLALHWRDRD
jgi:hypothetical protein